MNLDKEEKQLSESYESGEWQPVRKADELQRMREIAKYVQNLKTDSSN